jgi:hypothetical protein
LIHKGAKGVCEVLDHLRCIQIDALDRIGTNQDLVVMARVDGLKRGEIFSHLQVKTIGDEVLIYLK